MKNAALALLALVTALRLWLAGTLPVTPPEAFHWLCANRLEWAFFDEPAGTAWLVHLTSQPLGDGALGLRLAFPLLAALASFGAFLLGRTVFGFSAGLWAAAALNVLPFFNAASVHVGPELPALTFTLFAAACFASALHRGLPAWAVGGASLAFAVQFDYRALLLLPGIAIAISASARHLAEWRRPGIFLALLLPLAALVPSLRWNAAHDWPLLAGGTLRTALTPRWSEIGGAFLESFAFFPVFAFAAAVFAIGILAQAGRLHCKPRLALCLASPFLALWLYEILHGHPGGFASLFAFALLASGIAHSFLATPLRAVLGAAAFGLTAISSTFHIVQRSDPWSQSTRNTNWADVAASLDGLLARAQKPRLPAPILIAQDPDSTSALRYHLAHTRHPEVFLRESQDASNQFVLWPRYDDFSVITPANATATQEGIVNEGVTANPYIGRDALYITTEEPADLPQTIAAAFSHVAPFAVLELAGSRKLRVYLCEDYQTMPL